MDEDEADVVVESLRERFIEDAEKWLLDLDFFKKTMSAPAIAALSEQMNECLVLPQSDTVATQMKTMSAAENSSSLHDQLLAVIASDCANPQRTLTQSEECNALPSDHFTDDIKPTDSISNTCSKNSGKRSSSSGSRSGRSSTSSARLQVEAEMAALLARQQMLQRKHEVEEEEERLRKKKEQIDLQTKIAVSMAKVNVYRAAISEPSVHLEMSESRKKSDKMSSSNVIATASVQANAPVESRSVSNSTRDVDVRSTQPHSVQQPSSSSITPFQLSASFSGQQFSNRGGNMVRLMERQNEIAVMLVQQCNTSLLPHRDILPFDGDPLQYQSFIRSFEEVVEKRANNYGDCFYFLEHYTRGQPRELVRSCQHMASTQGYLRAKALLKEHFGNELKILSAYMDKVLSWKAIRPEDTRALQDYHLFLRACCNAMDDVRYMKELNLATNMQTILSKLPFKLRDKWRAVACELQEKRNTQAVFKDIVDFVEKQVKIATDPVFGNILEAPLSVNRNAYRSKMKGNSFATTVTVTDLEVAGLDQTHYCYLPEVYTQKSMPVSKANIPTQSDLVRWPYLNHVTLPLIEAGVELLIGANVPEALEPWQVVRGQRNGPYAVKTILGSTVNGPLKGMEKDGTFCNDQPQVTVNRISVSRLDELWKQQFRTDFPETAQDELVAMSKEDIQFMDMVSQSVKLRDGHYCIGLPLRRKDVVLPNNLIVAEQRALNLQRKFWKDSAFHVDYTAFMKDVISKGYAEKGPDLTSTLIGVLTRFRMEPVALMADIESMFYQVKVPAEDSDLLRFLWWSKGDLSKDLEEFRMLYKELKAMCAKGGFHLTKWMSNSRVVLNVIPEEDRVKEVKNLDLNHDMLPVERVLGVQWCAESDTFKFKIVVKERSFTRRGILSVISAIYDPLGFLAPVVLSAKRILQDLCREGVGWDSAIPIKYVQRWTNWLEDLHGLEKFEMKRCLKPVEFGEITVAHLHHFLDASEEGYGVVSYLLLHNGRNMVHSAFLMGKARVAPVKSITIPRMELTAAALASRMDQLWKRDLKMKLQDSLFWTDSTAVLKYIQHESSRFKCFVANRVSEILKASKATQWRHTNSANNPADFASRGLKVDLLLKEQMWTSGPPFLTRPPEEWPSSPINLGKSLVQDPEIKQEVVVNTLLVQTPEGRGTVTRLVNYYSSWTHLKKAVAWILRLKKILLSLSKRRKHLRESLVCSEPNQSLEDTINESMRKFRSSIRDSYLSVDELEESEMAIIRFSQKMRFPEELISSQRGEIVKRSSPLYRLNPTLDAGVIRMYGRLDNAVMPEEPKHPVILAKDLYVSELLIRHIHEEVGHSGRNYMLARLRQKYWIPGASSAIRRVLSRCVICKRLQGTAGCQQMANLPLSRVLPDEPPFTRVGVDCFGPFEIKRGR
ncbi:hypothetical protein M9458_051849, partial [Cirrhinus mrigala]